MPANPAALAGLKAMRELLSDPARWTKGTEARNAKGRPVRPWWKSATCWCLLGAPHAGARRCYRNAVQEEMALRSALGGKKAISGFNDDPTTTHADILALLDREIAAAGGES